MLKNAVLDFFKSVVVVVEFFFHFLEVEHILCVLVPGQVEQLVDVRELCVVVGRLWVESLQFFQLFFE